MSKAATGLRNQVANRLISASNEDSYKYASISDALRLILVPGYDGLNPVSYVV